MQLLLGIKAPTSIFFYLFCKCNKNQRSNMNIKWANGENKKGVFYFNLYFILSVFKFYNNLLLLM